MLFLSVSQFLEGFILKNGEHINPKNVLIHIATRDLQNYGVVSDEEFNNLFEASEKIWPNAKKISCQSFEGRICPYLF
jgi:hypothetical protein